MEAQGGCRWTAGSDRDGDGQHDPDRGGEMSIRRMICACLMLELELELELEVLTVEFRS